MAARKDAKPPKRPSQTAAKGRAARKRSQSAAASEPSGRRKFAENLIHVTATAQFEPGAARSAGIRQAVPIAQHRDDLVEIVFDNGLHYYTSFDQFRADRGEPASRDLVPNAEFVIPSALPGPSADRGVGSWAIKALRFLDIDPIEAGAELTATEVCKWYEQKQLHRADPGDTDTQRLWRIAPGEEFTLQGITSPIAGTEPLLIFLHGTASSSRGSFGELWTPAGRESREDILRGYGNRVFAFEHYSLTQSPIANTLALLESLPDGARLHLVSYSRGGLIGELLSRAQMIDRDPFEADDIALFKGADYAAQRAELAALNTVLKKKKIRVERFARVACPARGTTLASERMDRWLSIALDLVGGIADLASSGFYDVFAEFVKAFVHTRAKPGELPGLEAMMPTSPLVRLLNRADVQTSADLRAVAGDIEGGSLLRRFGILLTDMYYREDHDLIVNTRAMYGGTPRVTPPRRFFAQGPDVNHFTYFRNRPTAQKIAAALHASPSQDGFSAFDQRISVPPRGFRSPAPAARGAGGSAKPIVVVLPGIMGSLLDVNGTRVWMDVGELNRGGMSSLAFDAPGVTATGLMEDPYGSLLAFLERTHEVVPFPFDWRISLRAEAKRLAGALKPWLDEADRRRQPLSIIAHSLGGLLARVMIAEYPAVWERLVAKPQGRLVQLGTPNGGSYSIPFMLVGRDDTVKKLALIDFKNSQTELLQLIAAFPGVLELLPRSATDFFDPATWSRLRALDGAFGEAWQPPAAAALRTANGVREILDGATPNLDRLVYVAGQAPSTPFKLNMSRPPAPIGGPEQSTFATEEYYFEATPEGDGRVPWATGILAGVRTWYMDAVHGDLAATPRHFEALLDLLTSGSTNRLPTMPPSTAKRGVASIVYRSGTVDYVPDVAGLEAAVLGRQHDRRAALTGPPPIEVVVTQGNLVFSRTPVFVGHYVGDAIISAEARIDREMKGRLSANYHLGLYPGRIGTAKPFLGQANPSSSHVDFPGAIVVGLGPVGELTPGTFAATFERAVLAYIVAMLESDAQRGSGGIIEARITTLLIGTGWNALAVRDSISAILRGAVRANAALARSEYSDRVRVVKVEFLELYEDRAIQAVRALHVIASDPELSECIRMDGVLRKIVGGRRRAFFEDEGAWWHRLQIASEKDGALKFTMLTDRARAETTLQATQRALVESFVERQIATTDSDTHLAVTLFELLLPNGIKDRAPEGRDLVLVLDKQTAGYPWELLQDGAVPEASSAAGAAQTRVALRAGLIRQLATDRFRPMVKYATGRSALVVGNPKIESDRFPDLPGASREAEIVADALSDGVNANFDVKRLISPNSAQVIEALFARPYRILHLAGHGVYEYARELTPDELRRKAAGEGVSQPKVTGMVLGNGIFLTPAEVAQMRAVPELVFINCCHLGRIDVPDGSGDERSRSRHLLAANLATEFIEMGVKVVVAAGWAVNDSAAALFAKTLYEQLLSGDSFGPAVLTARRRTATEYAAYNTWGAYQCYGDYAWRLVTRQDTRSTGGTPDFAASSELLLELANMASDAKSAWPSEVEGLATRVREWLEWVSAQRTPWLDLAEVREAFARAFGELDLFGDALAQYALALCARPANFPVSGIEQYANLMTRAALVDFRAARNGRDRAAAVRQRTAAKEKIERAIVMLDHLLAFAKSVERYALLGAAWKRLAVIEESPGSRRKALSQMRDRYWEAHQEALAAGGVNAYPLVNWLVAEACLGATLASGPSQGTASSRADLAGLIKQVEQQLGKADEFDFWAIVQHADLMLARALLQARLDTAALDAVMAEYRRAAARAGSPREFRSVAEHVEFIAVIYTEKEGTAARRAAVILQQFADELRGTAQDSAEVAFDASPPKSAPRQSRKAPSKRGTAPKHRLPLKR